MAILLRMSGGRWTLLTLLSVFACALLSFGLASTAFAQPANSGSSGSSETPVLVDGDEAKKNGDAAMVALHYEEALAWYRAAFQASKNPAILYNMGRAYEGLGEFPQALDALEEFQNKASDDLKARVPKLAELLRDVGNRVSTLVVSAPVQDAEIWLGERVVGMSKVGQVVLRVKAGEQRLVVRKEGYFPFEKDLNLVGGKIETIEAKLGTRTTSGLIRVTSPVVGAAVALDGKAIGTVPAESAMEPGSHVIALERDGYEPARANVVLAAGERKDVDIPMAKRASILGKWWFWTAVGIVAAGGVATIIALTTEKSPDSGTIAPGQVKAELRF
jgi:hypothetical protein